jgi:hypothetical protein
MPAQKMRRTRVYVAGPMTLGDFADNIRCGMEAAYKLIQAGYAPYCPHLSHFQQLTFPLEYEQWMELDFEWLPLCDVLLRLPGFSRGAEREVALAREHGIFVYPGLGCLLHECSNRVEVTTNDTATCSS